MNRIILYIYTLLFILAHFSDPLSLLPDLDFYLFYLFLLLQILWINISILAIEGIGGTQGSFILEEADCPKPYQLVHTSSFSNGTLMPFHSFMRTIRATIVGSGNSPWYPLAMYPLESMTVDPTEGSRCYGIIMFSLSIFWNQFFWSF